MTEKTMDLGDRKREVTNLRGQPLGSLTVCAGQNSDMQGLG
jgi:hypothetical protein